MKPDAIDDHGYWFPLASKDAQESMADMAIEPQWLSLVVATLGAGEATLIFGWDDGDNLGEFSDVPLIKLIESTILEDETVDMQMHLPALRKLQDDLDELVKKLSAKALVNTP